MRAIFVQKTAIRGVTKNRWECPECRHLHYECRFNLAKHKDKMFILCPKCDTRLWLDTSNDGSKTYECPEKLHKTGLGSEDCMECNINLLFQGRHDQRTQEDGLFLMPDKEGKLGEMGKKELEVMFGQEYKEAQTYYASSNYEARKALKKMKEGDILVWKEKREDGRGNQ